MKVPTAAMELHSGSVTLLPSLSPFPLPLLFLAHLLSQFELIFLTCNQKNLSTLIAMVTTSLGHYLEET